MSKGGSNTSSTQVPAWLENAAIENINKGRDVSQIGYTPYYGPDVAAFNPMQQQSMQSTGNAASAFGLAPQGFDAMAGMPEAQTFAGGVQGYSSAPLYEQAVSSLAQNRPAQYNAINSMFIDPFTGAPAQGNYAASPTQVSQMFSNGGDMGGVMGGGATQPDYQPSTDGGTGYWGGGERTATQTNDMTDPEFEAYVLANGLPPEDQYTNGDAVRGIAGNLMDSGIFGHLYEGVTGSPLSGGSPNAPVSELSNADVSGGYPQSLISNTPAPYQVETYGIPSPNITGGPSDLMSLIAEQDAARSTEALRVEAAQVAAQQAAAARARQSNNNEGAGAAQRSAAADRNSSGGGYGGGGGSYDPSGRW
jgi:hypothetical protein